MWQAVFVILLVVAAVAFAAALAWIAVLALRRDWTARSVPNPEDPDG